MKRKSLLSQGSLSRMAKAAEASWRRRDFQKAIETYENVMRRDPANSGVLLDLGRAYGMRYDYEAAERCFEKAIRIAPQRTKMLAIVAQQCRDFRNPAMAERYLLRAVEQKDAEPGTLINLAELYERLRRVEQAVQLVERALQSDPASPEALLTRARLDRQAGRLEEAEERLRNFPANADPTLQARAGYELGGILDRRGKFDEAMAAFLKAKALLRPQFDRPIAELKIMRMRLKELRTSISAGVLQEWFNCGPGLSPSYRLAVLCGHPRSGTTLLEQVLDSHPDIVSAEETDIFHDDSFVPLMRDLPDDAPLFSVLQSARPAALQQSRKDYFRSMELSLGHPIADRLLIDKNPTYTFLVLAYMRVFPEMKFLVALRDPRDVCLSCFMQYIPFNQVGAAFLSLETTVDEYAELMTMWQTIAPLMKNPFLEVRYEDMVADLQSVARKTLGFLEVPWDDRVLGFDAHARNKLVRSPTYADVAKPVYKRAIGRWHNYQKYLEPYLGKLEPFVKAFGYE